MSEMRENGAKGISPEDCEHSHLLEKGNGNCVCCNCGALFRNFSAVIGGRLRRVATASAETTKLIFENRDAGATPAGITKYADFKDHLQRQCSESENTEKQGKKPPMSSRTESLFKYDHGAARQVFKKHWRLSYSQNLDGAPTVRCGCGWSVCLQQRSDLDEETTAQLDDLFTFHIEQAISAVLAAPSDPDAWRNPPGASKAVVTRSRRSCTENKDLLQRIFPGWRVFYEGETLGVARFDEIVCFASPDKLLSMYGWYEHLALRLSNPTASIAWLG